MNPLNTSWNKSTYVALWTAVIAVVTVFAPDFGITLTTTKLAAIQGLGSVLINMFVPNKEVS